MDKGLEEFKKFVQGALDYGIPGYEDTTTERKGGFVGPNIPPSPEEFRKQLTDREEYSKYNDWQLDTPEANKILGDAYSIYKRHFTSWITVPLAADASPKIIAWWKAEREKAGL